jgi:hypothetical protein
MTATPSIALPAWMAEQLSQAGTGQPITRLTPMTQRRCRRFGSIRWRSRGVIGCGIGVLMMSGTLHR